MEKLNEKLQRYLELSREFTVSSDKVYDGFQTNYSTFYSSGSVIHGISVMYDPKEKTPTKLEQFEIAQKEKIEKAKRFEEYLQLQTDLSNYYTALNKIENN